MYLGRAFQAVISFSLLLTVVRGAPKPLLCWVCAGGVGAINIKSGMDGLLACCLFVVVVVCLRFSSQFQSQWSVIWTRKE